MNGLQMRHVAPMTRACQMRPELSEFALMAHRRSLNVNVAQLLKEGIHFRALSQLSAIFTVHDRRG